ncbi:MAG TPA: hypothetical protein VFC58_02420 [Desulfosporosinus sp.]|nr:hypothetical protein [Desulfosporosinus sp.]
MRSSKLSFPIIFALIFIMCSTIFLIFGTPWSYYNYKNKFHTYLDNKYHKEFVIGKISYDYLHGKLFSANAYAINQPDICFYVGQNYKTKEIEDGYPFEMWQYQARKDLAPILEKFYPDINYSVTISPINDKSIFEESEIPNYINCTMILLGVSMTNFEVTDYNQLNEIKKAYLLLAILKKKGVNLSNFSISYKNKTINLKYYDINLINDLNDIKKYLVDYK